MEGTVQLVFFVQIFFIMIVGLNAQSAVCPNMTTLNETSGVLTSPYYPRTYPISTNCSWKITANKGERIVLVIEDIKIPECGSSCTCDYLQIQNGSSSDGLSGRRRCGYFKDRGIVYYSTKDVLRVTFVSDSRTSSLHGGFKATYIKVKYDAVTTGCASGTNLHGLAGFIASPNFPNNYTQYSRCARNITVPNGYIIELTFHYFQLGPYQKSHYCYFDATGARVTIINVATNNHYDRIMLCGQSVPPPVYSVGNSIQVIFTSLRNQYPGFNATYRAIRVCPNMTTLNETSGVLTSPYYPKTYPISTHCSWKITASKGERIVLVIKDIKIQECASSCTCDYLQIQNGSSSDGISGRRRCRYKNRGIVYYSTKDVLRVTFVSDSRISSGYRGFRATYIKVKYDAVTAGCTTEPNLHGLAGFIAIPNFPNNYPQYSRCAWNITVPNGYIVKLSFLYFQLEPAHISSCYNDAPGARVTITNVATSNNYRSFMLCGQSVPHPVYSVKNSVQLIFTSLSKQYSGFNATYRAITYESVCPNMATLNETSGVLTSPYYPRTYPSSANCSWKITASKGERIVLVIEDIFIWGCGSSCTCDYLQIQNGSSSDGFSGRRRCGYFKDRGIVYYSTKDVLRVTFVSDSRTSSLHGGFKATYIKVKYDAVTTDCANGTNLHGLAGFIASPNFPNNYPQYSRCAWNITVPSGYFIKLTFLHFQLEPLTYLHIPCYYGAPGARVTITNVATNNNYRPFMLCGQSVPHPVYSVGNSVQVIFTSLSKQYSGFKATYRAMSNESDPVKPSPILDENIGQTEVIVEFINKKTLSNGNPVRYFQMIVLQLTEGQDPGSSANRIYEIIGRKYEDQVEGQPYITAEFARDESRTVFTVGDGKYYSRSAIAEAKGKRKDTSGFTKYLNGKLEGNTEYVVFQRSFDKDSGYEDQGFVQFTTKAFQFDGTESSKLKTKSKFPTVNAIMVGVVLFVVLGITATCIVWRRCHQGYEMKQRNDFSTQDVMEMSANINRSAEPSVKKHMESNDDITGTFTGNCYDNDVNVSEEGFS